MGHKTVIFTNDIEQKTYIQGEFTGKYRGVLNSENWRSNIECYDIHIYQGEVSNLKNEIENPEIINETIYNATTSESQLTQKSFKNVIVNLENTIENFDSFRLTIKDPKLELVQIYDVLKDGNQTFGTLNCLVKGFISKTSVETNEMQVETCDQCNQFLEECTCSDVHTIAKDSVQVADASQLIKPWKPHSWTSGRSFGCLSILGILTGILILFFFGLPGILIGSFILLIYALNYLLSRYFPHFSRSIRWLFYTLIALLFLGWLLRSLEDDNQVKNSSLTIQKDEATETRSTEEIKKNRNSIPANSKSHKDNINTTLKQNAPFRTSDISYESSESQNFEANNSSQTNVQFPFNQANSSEVENIEFPIEEINNSSELTLEFQNNQSNITPQISRELQTQAAKNRQKIKKTVEIMAGIEFHEGEVFICKGESSTRYHFNPSCPGLSNCSTRIYQVNIPVAERLGRTLCKIEE